MEMHHKLRRDPNWHPSGCNICGQLGHQAVNCTNGTINWRRIYGDDAFRLKPPSYPSEQYEAQKAKVIDFAALEADAKAWAAERASLMVEPGSIQAQPEALKQEAKPGTATAPDEPLPEGWAAAKDTQGRTYYWHKATKGVQWSRPDASTPVPSAA